MPQLIVTTREGETRSLDAQSGMSAMEAIRDAGVDEMLALCGGVCSCATCHVHVDPDWIEKVGLRGEDEEDLLDTSDYKIANSRLSCQILFTPELDGLRVQIAPED